MRVIEHQPPEPTYPGVFDLGVFLAGPIQGARDWQNEAVEVFSEIYEGDNNLHLFNPRRDILPEPFDDKLYKEQVYWEQDHLAKAARIGGHLFWLEAQDHSLSYPKGREYAKTTKKELGMTIGSILFGQPVKLSIGIDPNFEVPERYFRTTLNRMGLPIHTTLRDTCRFAMAHLK